MIRGIAIALVLFLASCYAEQVREIGPGQFVDYGDTPIEHTIYLGSDDQYHYFAWSHGKSGGRWKIDRDLMNLNRVFPVTDGRSAFLYTDDEGQLQPWPPE